MKRLITNTLIITAILLALVNCIYAVGDVDISGGNSSGTVNNLVVNIWATISVVIYVLAVGCIVFAGLRYVLSSTDAKADIKKQTRYFIYRSYFSIWSYFYCKYCICYDTGERTTTCRR